MIKLERDILQLVNVELPRALVKVNVCPLLCMAANDMESARRAAQLAAKAIDDAVYDAGGTLHPMTIKQVSASYAAMYAELSAESRISEDNIAARDFLLRSIERIERTCGD